MTSSIKIYLTDLNNDLRGKPFPLNVSYIASYLLSQNKNLSIKLYKDPHKLCDDIQSAPPDILGMSNFSWNNQLNLTIAQWAKKHNPGMVTVYGGLNLTVNDSRSVQGFFRNNPFIDAHIHFTPEEVMNFFVKKIAQHDFNMKKFVESEPLPSGLIAHANGQITRGSTQMFETQKDLDYIPSPYLTGLMDEFLAHKDLFPIFETCRGCPYSCTFCCWGARTLSKLQTYSMERVIAELDYIRAAKPANKYLYCADGNFGIFKRDIEIAHHLRKMYDTGGFPDPIFLYLAKNNTDNVIEIAKILAPIFQVNIARQSENETVLSNIKRKNISSEAFTRIQQSLDGSRINNQIEIIYSLPGETLATFYDGLKSIMDRVDPEKGEIRMYPLLLLRGSEMSEPDYVEKFQIKTALRRSSINSGFQYMDNEGKEIFSLEVDQVVISNSSFSFKDFMNVRVFHFFLCMFQTYKIYSYVLRYLKEKHALNPIAFLQNVVEEILKISPAEYPSLKAMIDGFLTEINDELYFTDDVYDVEHIIKDLRNKPFKRLNIYYILKLLYSPDIKNDFYNFLIDKILQKYMTKEGARGVVSYMDAFIVDFNNYEASKTMTVLDPASEEMKTVRLFVGDIVNQTWHKVKNEKISVLDALDTVYVLTYPGYLHKVLLYKSEVTETAVKPLVYTLH